LRGCGITFSSGVLRGFVFSYFGKDDCWPEWDKTTLSKGG
jgi:hypothetical protein